MSVCFIFDLDGTITTEEILPILATELSLEEELHLLTKLTLTGAIPFESSFRLRYALLKAIHPDVIRDLVLKIPLNPDIENFIKSNKDRCFIATGNLNVWVRPIIDKLGCQAFTSIAQEDSSGQLSNLEILRKNTAVFKVRKHFDTVVVIGESVNDLPMFEAADIGVAFGGVHQPVHEIIQISTYVCYEGSSLCRLLNTL
ncbi:MAG: HAD-IB family phosphatase [Gammaproteobacteria bacterium]|nr:HAD-IB family phosphatase [Gammaproteobacteria bacterium]